MSWSDAQGQTNYDVHLSDSVMINTADMLEKDLNGLFADLNCLVPSLLTSGSPLTQAEDDLVWSQMHYNSSTSSGSPDLVLMLSPPGSSTSIESSETISSTGTVNIPVETVLVEAAKREKRREQNRRSQRAFRDRQEQRYRSLQLAYDSLNDKYRELLQSFDLQSMEKQQLLAMLQNEAKRKEFDKSRLATGT